jgi:hypothetical protein
VPDEETVFSFFWAPSREAVEALNARAGVAYDRVVPAVALGAASFPSG